MNNLFLVLHLSCFFTSSLLPLSPHKHTFLCPILKQQQKLFFESLTLWVNTLIFNFFTVDLLEKTAAPFLALSIHFLTILNLSIFHETPLKPLFVNITLDFLIPKQYLNTLIHHVFLQALLYCLLWHRAISIPVFHYPVS